MAFKRNALLKVEHLRHHYIVWKHWVIILGSWLECFFFVFFYCVCLWSKRNVDSKDPIWETKYTSQQFLHSIDFPYLCKSYSCVKVGVIWMFLGFWLWDCQRCFFFVSYSQEFGIAYQICNYVCAQIKCTFTTNFSDGLSVLSSILKMVCLSSLMALARITSHDACKFVSFSRSFLIMYVPCYSCQTFHDAFFFLCVAMMCYDISISSYCYCDAYPWTMSTDKKWCCDVLCQDIFVSYCDATNVGHGIPPLLGVLAIFGQESLSRWSHTNCL